MAAIAYVLVEAEVCDAARVGTGSERSRPGITAADPMTATTVIARPFPAAS